MLQGCVRLENRFGTRLLTDEEKSTSTAKSAPTSAQFLSEEDILGFIMLPESQTGGVAIPPLKAIRQSQIVALIPTEAPAPAPEATSAPQADPDALPAPASATPSRTESKPASVLAPATARAQLGEIMPSVSPHVFVGNAIVAGHLVPDGTQITAWLQGFQQPLAEDVTSDGRFLLVAPQYSEDSFAGRTLTFMIGGLDAAETATMAQGAADVLNLTAPN